MTPWSGLQELWERVSPGVGQAENPNVVGANALEYIVPVNKQDSNLERIAGKRPPELRVVHQRA